jgi:hypothetical protein
MSEINELVKQLWLGHYNSHKSDWWQTKPENFPINLNSYRSVILTVLEMSEIDWKSTLSPEELTEAEDFLKMLKKSS